MRSFFFYSISGFILGKFVVLEILARIIILNCLILLLPFATRFILAVFLTPSEVRSGKKRSSVGAERRIFKQFLRTFSFKSRFGSHGGKRK